MAETTKERKRISLARVLAVVADGAVFLAGVGCLAGGAFLLGGTGWCLLAVGGALWLDSILDGLFRRGRG